jgi:Na+-driven multidrug efflux pump
MTSSLTEGKPLGVLLRFFLPLFLGNLFQQLYLTVDSVIVGRFLGVQGLAAVGSTGSFSYLGSAEEAQILSVGSAWK